MQGSNLFDKIGGIGATIGDSVARQRGFGGRSQGPQEEMLDDDDMQFIQEAMGEETPGVGISDPMSLMEGANMRMQKPPKMFENVGQIRGGMMQ